MLSEFAVSLGTPKPRIVVEGNWHGSIIFAEKAIDLEVHWHVFEGNGLFCRKNTLPTRKIHGRGRASRGGHLRCLIPKAEELPGACW